MSAAPVTPRGMQYLLTGFTQDTGVRLFAFDGVADHWMRTTYSVKVDLALSRKHGIRMQELPLLCRAVLDQRSASDDRHAFTFTEDDMTIHSDRVRAALEAKQKKTPRRPFAAAATASVSAVQPV
jgi:hypothetical protein